MQTTNDLWFIRLPDGRILRAAGAGAVRQQLAAGRFPPGTRLRRSLEDRWLSAERFPEFADVTPPSREAKADEAPIAAKPNGWRVAAAPAAPATIASRLDPAQLRQVGVRGYLDEMLAALDSTAVACKLQAAALAGVLLAVLAMLARLPGFELSLQEVGWGWLLVACAVLVLGALSGVVARMTFAELSRLRPCLWGDGLRGFGTLTLRLAVAYTLVGGIVGSLVATVRWLPGEMLLLAETRQEQAWAVAAQAAAALAVPAEVLLWLLLVMLQPLAALLVVEECSVVFGLWQWLKLMRRNAARLLVAEGLALSVAVALALPLAALLALLMTWTPDPALAPTVEAARAVAVGLALAVPLAYVLVANVFIYLNLRYQAVRR